MTPRDHAATVRSLLFAAARVLGADRRARLEAELLLAGVLAAGRARLYAHPEMPVAAAAARRFRALLDRRALGWPVAYLTGLREFWSLPLRVNTHTLIPRPETEEVVRAALKLIPAGTAARIADLGTGCGAIAVAIASERPAAQVLATDICPRALRVAAANGRRARWRNLRLRRGDWYAPLRGMRFDLIVSNPPYVAPGDPHLKRGDLRFEPRRALVGRRDGLQELRALVAGAPAHLAPGGALILEHGCGQGEQARGLFRRRGYRRIRTHRDLAGRERVTQGSAPP